MQDVDARRYAQGARVFARAGPAAVAVISLANLLAWIVGWTLVTEPQSWVWRLLPGTAAGLLFSAIALFVRVQFDDAPGRARLAAVSGALGAMIGLALLVGIGIQEDEAAFLWLPHRLDDAQPSLLVALMITLLGLAPVARIAAGPRGAQLSSAIALGSAWLAMVSLTSIAYGLRDRYGIMGFAQAGACAASLTLILATATIAAEPGNGLMKLVLGDTVGGALARRLIPAAVAIPLGVGALRVIAERSGLISLEYGTAFLANAAIALMVVVIWRTGTSVAAQEAARREALAALEDSEENLRATLDSIAEAVIATDDHCRIVRMNPSAERLTGWSAAEAVGHHIDEIGRVVDAATREPVAIPVRKALADGAALLLDGDLLLVARSGTETPVADSASPIRTAAGTICGVVLVFRETTIEVEARRRLLAAEGQLRQKQKMEAIGRLAGGIAHDFNNLLSIIVGYGEILAADVPEGEGRMRVTEIVRAAERAADLTRQLLAFSRQQVLQLEVLDANRVVRELEGLLRRLVSEDVALELRLDQGELPIEADRGQLTQVLLNLCANARDAMPEGGRLTIETVPRRLTDEDVSGDERPGDYVCVSVTDTGTGMDADTRERLFEPFFTTKAVGEGTGLGLATVFGIVEQSLGFVRVTTEPGAGSRFDVFLPRAERPLAVPTRPSPGPAPAHETVLLVEDDPQVRAALRTMLDRMGYHVVTASNGADAVVAFTQQGVDVVVTDMVMPHMSGTQLVAELRARRPDLPVVTMSGYARGGLAAQLVRSPHTRFLQKPIGRDQLARALREVIDGA